MRSELQTVLASRSFRQSRGLAKLLKYICGKALLDESEPVTEYTIAVDVLGKNQDFKESKDASVRVEVHRLRRRLAEYYEQEGVDDPIRIVIPTGQYVPRFLTLAAATPAEPHPGAESEPAISTAVERPPEMPAAAEPILSSGTGWKEVIRSLWSRIPVRVGLALVAIAAAALGVWTTLPRTDALDAFWKPVLASPAPVLLCLGNLEGGRHQGAVPPLANITMNEYQASERETVLFSDAATLARFAGLLQAKGKSYHLATQSDATYSDLQNGPAVLIGLLNNDWTGRLVGQLRFSVERRRPGRVLLRDRERPDKEDWMMDYRTPFLDITKDYALVLRVIDPKTEQTVVTAAGISVFGTLAAGEFLTNPQEFRKIEAVAPRGWQKMNCEIVLSTDVIRGKTGHPSVVAAHFW